MAGRGVGAGPLGLRLLSHVAVGGTIDGGVRRAVAVPIESYVAGATYADDHSEGNC